MLVALVLRGAMAFSTTASVALAPNLVLVATAALPLARMAASEFAVVVAASLSVAVVASVAQKRIPRERQAGLNSRV